MLVLVLFLPLFEPLTVSILAGLMGITQPLPRFKTHQEITDKTPSIGGGSATTYTSTSSSVNLRNLRRSIFWTELDCRHLALNLGRTPESSSEISRTPVVEHTICPPPGLHVFYYSRNLLLVPETDGGVGRDAL